MYVASKTVADKYPYVMIQPCMSNRKENKVACFQGQPMHICSIKRGGNDNSKKISKTDNEILLFAQDAINIFKLNCPYAITDGLFRVDMFQNAQGKLVVNEFESLEANYSSSKHLDESFILRYLHHYWKNMIYSDLFKYINET